jgi:iron complex transport system ATP-binding protein
VKEQLLRARRLSVGYRHRGADTTVLSGLDLELYAGELVCLLGPNGAGKTTLLRTLAGLEAPLAGLVEILGNDLRALAPRERARQVGVVLTEPIAVGMLTAWDLVALGRHPFTGRFGALSPLDRERMRGALESVGALTLIERPLAELSDGERQKVMIARALAQDSRLLLLDEPTAFLDVPRRVEIMALLRRLAQQSDRAVLLTTHSLDLALDSADRLWLLGAGEGLLAGTPEDLLLDGSFAACFAAPGIELDPASGQFRPRGDAGEPVGVVGDGLPLVWTRHALVRRGFRITAPDEPSQLSIVIEGGVDGLRWRVAGGRESVVCATIGELLAALERA